jgi:gluconolactonase
MKTGTVFATVVILLAAASSFFQAGPAAQGAQQAAQAGMPDKPVTVAGIPGVVAADAKEERLWTTATTSGDGLIADPKGTLLLPQQGASQISKVDKDGNVTAWLMDTNQAGGVAFDTKGRLIAIERGMPRVEYLAPERKLLLDSYDGKPLEGAGDIIADLKGGFYFTEGRKTPPASALYYIDGKGKATRVASYEKERVNGVTLSPDGKTLYLAYGMDTLMAYDVQPDGSIQNRRDFGKFVNGRPDGLLVDAASRVYGATAAGVEVLSPQGQSLGLIPTPRGITTICFAGPDKKTLYFLGRGNDAPDGGARNARSLYKIPMIAQGFTKRVK